jgi:hypothetical protein
VFCKVQEYVKRRETYILWKEFFTLVHLNAINLVCQSNRCSCPAVSRNGKSAALTELKEQNVLEYM